jgi:hypothetical protein
LSGRNGRCNSITMVLSSIPEKLARNTITSIRPMYFGNPSRERIAGPTHHDVFSRS